MKLTHILLAALFLLPVTGDSQQTGDCVDIDGDGWGWNEILKKSCIPPGGIDSDRKDPVGVKIGWVASRPAEMVEGYVLRLLVNNMVAAEERTDGISLVFSFDVINVTSKDEICVQVAAFRQSETSAYSGLNCIVVPDKQLPAMAVPGTPAMVWSY